MKQQYVITNQKQLRKEFWSTFPELVCRTNRKGNPLPQNAQPADTRMSFVDWIDQLERNGQISSELAQRATL